MKNGTKLQIINQMCKCFSMFLKKITWFFLLYSFLLSHFIKSLQFTYHYPAMHKNGNGSL